MEGFGEAGRRGLDFVVDVGVRFNRGLALGDLPPAVCEDVLGVTAVPGSDLRVPSDLVALAAVLSGVVLRRRPAGFDVAELRGP